MAYFKRLFGIFVFVSLIAISIQQDSSECEQDRADIVFVLDSSGSICEDDTDSQCDNYNLLLQFVESFVDRLTIGPDAYQVGIVTFANVGRNIVFLNQFSDKSALIDAIRDVPYENGNTNTSGGLRVMHFEQFTRANGDRADAPNIAIVMTDGESTWDSDRTIPDAEAARIAGIQIYSIGITESIDETEVRRISSRPQERNENYFLSPSFDILDEIVEDLVTQTCNLAPEPQERKKAKIDFCFDDKTDVVFVVDASGSICGRTSGDLSCGRWELVLEFIIDIIDTMNVGKDKNRIGFVRYSAFADNQFYLDSFDTRYQVKEAIRNIDVIGSETNTSGAIHLMRHEQFTRRNGDRKSAENVAIIITDGESNIDRNATIPEAKKARRDDITIYSIGITDSINVDEVKHMSSQPQKKDKNYFLSTDFESLRTMKIKIECEDREYNAVLFGMLALAVVILLLLLRLLTLFCHMKTKKYDDEDKEPLYSSEGNTNRL